MTVDGTGYHLGDGGTPELRAHAERMLKNPEFVKALDDSAEERATTAQVLSDLYALASNESVRARLDILSEHILITLKRMEFYQEALGDRRSYALSMEQERDEAVSLLGEWRLFSHSDSYYTEPTDDLGKRTDAILRRTEEEA